MLNLYKFHPKVLINLYFFATLANSSKFLQTAPEGLLGELSIRIKFFFFPIFLIFFSSSLAVGNQLLALEVSIQ